MRLSRQFQACLFFFTKRFPVHKKHQKAKQTTFKFSHAENCCHSCSVFGYFCFVVSFLLVTCFSAWKSFCKKNEQAWNCLDNLILLYYWHAPLSTHLLSLHLHAFVFICSHLWESFWILFTIICVDLFF